MANLKAKLHAIFSSGISVIKSHYLLLIVTPLFFHISEIIITALNFYQLVPIIVRVIGLTWVVILILYIFLIITYLWKKKRLIAIYCLIVSIVTLSTINDLRNRYGIDDEGLDFYFKQKEYRRMIDAAPSRNKPGEPKLAIIEIEPLYECSTRYLVYDESDEMMNKDNHYYGIKYVDRTLPNGPKEYSDDGQVSVRKFEGHIYIADISIFDNWGASPCEP